MKFKNKKFTWISALVSTGVITSLATVAVTSCASTNKEAKASNNNLEGNINAPENAAYVTLTFNANGGTITGSKTIKMRSGKPFGSITPPKATWEGHSFKGWYTDATGGQELEPTTVINESKTVYAQWDVVLETKTLTFSKGTDTDITFKGDTEVLIYEGETFADVARPDAFKAGYDFVCWHYDGADITDETDVDYTDFAKDKTQNIITPVFTQKAKYIEIETDEYVSNDEIALQYSSTLTAHVYGTGTVSQEVKWSSSDATILVVDQEDGTLTPIKEGTAIITATTEDETTTETKTIKVVKPYDKYTDRIYAFNSTDSTYWIADQDTLCDANGSAAIELIKAGTELLEVTDVTDTISRANFNFSIYVGTDVLALNDYFLYNCPLFGTGSTSFTILNTNNDSRLTFIGDLFMGDCIAWTQNITFPNTLKYIGNDFMSGCTAVTAATMPVGLSYVGESFMVDCESLTNLTINCSANVFADQQHIDTLTVTDQTAAAYVTGITVAGTGADSFIAKFDEMLSGPLYRNYTNK